LPEAQVRAAALAKKQVELARLNVAAAKYHRQAAQADYFPKISSDFFNLHFNKFMGQEIQLLSRFPTLARPAAVPLLNRDLSLFSVTVTQPITPLFKVREAVRVARADERIADAKAQAVATRVAADVEHTYLSLLIAQRQLVAANLKARMMANGAQTVTSTVDPAVEQQRASLETIKSVAAANSEVMELTQALNTLMGTPLDTQLELADPPPLVETGSVGPLSPQAVDENPEVIEARETLVKARAAARVSKLNYMPEVAGLWSYYNQNAIPLLPNDFSTVGFVASWNVFDFGKRERTIKESDTQVRMAELNLELVRAKVAASAQKASLEVQRTRRVLELTRRLVSMYRAMPAAYQKASLDVQMAQAEAEAEMFQAEFDYRRAYAELKGATEEVH
jgi:outer membrane protein TolC